jgi:hypothetical protein
MANGEKKRTRLTEQQILQIGREYLKKNTTMTQIALDMKIDKGSVRNAIGNLKRHNVEFPDKPRETSSRYDGIAASLLKKGE